MIQLITWTDLMDDFDPDQQKIMAVLEPFLPRMFPLFGDALKLYTNEVSARARAEHDDRATACAVWCHLWSAFQQEFTGESGFHFLEHRGLKALNIKDLVVLRVKKVDANGRHRNSDTQQQRAFDKQDELPNMPSAASRIVMGYQPDLAFSQVERVTIRRPLGSWVSQVVEINDSCSWVDITPIELPFLRNRESKKTG
jgi:hypothetical protein